MIKQELSLLPLLMGVLLLPTTACGQGRQQPAVDPPGLTTVGMTLKDFTAKRAKRMLSSDTDGDGRVSRAEFLASNRSGKGDPARRFDRLDRNADGLLDKQEIDAMASRRFRRLDADADGIVTVTERTSVRAAAKRNDSED